MNALHTKKIDDEKNAFIESIYNSIPSKELYINGNKSIRARSIHKVLLPVYIMKYYSKDVYSSGYLEVIITNIIESECLFFLGFSNAAFTALRGALESSFKFLFYEYHPIESILHKGKNHQFLSSRDYREFFYVFPSLQDISFLARERIEEIWTRLCKFAHSDFHTIKKMTLVSDISIEILDDEDEFNKLLDMLKEIIKIILSVFFAINPRWAEKIEKTYFDAIMEAYSVNERTEVKTYLRIY